MNVAKVLNSIIYAKNPKQPYGGATFEHGYHSLVLGGTLYKGQRDNSMRMSSIPFDFKDKVVLDVGCNVGGMLHEIAPVIRYGVGIDRDANYINAANVIRDYNNTHNINFYSFDLSERPVSEIDSFVLLDKIDICFFLSMTMWLKNWIDIVVYLKSISDNLLIELNGSDQDEQEVVIRKMYENVLLVYNKSLDDKGQQDRRLLLCNDIK